MTTEIEQAIATMQAALAVRKASLKGVELMQHNLYWKLRRWIMRETSRRCVNIGEIADKIQKYAPKAILKSREQFKYAVNNLWRTVHDFDIDSDDYMREDLEFELSFIFK